MEIQQVKKDLETNGTESLSVGLLEISDLAHLDWAGDASHLEHVRLQLLAPGNTASLAVRTPAWDVVGKGLLDFSASADAGVIGQLATRPELQGLGVGTFLIREMERQIKNRGRTKAELGVELINHRARMLYERLGYSATHIEHHSWTATDDKGENYLHNAEVQMMSKALKTEW